MSKAVRYTLTVWATIPIDDFDGEPEYGSRGVEKEVIKALKRLFDVDAEVVDSQEIEE